MKEEFRLLTSFVLPREVFETSPLTSCVSVDIPTLNLHLARLEDGHYSIAKALPDSWCAKESPIDRKPILDALNSTIESHRKSSDPSPLRVRLTVGRSHTISLTTSPFSFVQPDELLVAIDDRPTSYEGDPFLSVKTTNRTHYDHTRLRHASNRSQV